LQLFQSNVKTGGRTTGWTTEMGPGFFNRKTGSFLGRFGCPAGKIWLQHHRGFLKNFTLEIARFFIR
jgi:hypothetical protein